MSLNVDEVDLLPQAASRLATTTSQIGRRKSHGICDVRTRTFSLVVRKSMPIKWRRGDLLMLRSLLLVVIVELCNLYLSSLELIQAQSLLQQQQQQQQQNNLPQYQQHNNILHFYVPEGAPIGTFLGNIRSADGQAPFLVLPAPATPESERVAALGINLTNGDLTTNSILDREHREMYQFVAIVKDPFAEIKCTVTVKDVNDNAPIFLMPTANETNFVIEMPEGQRGVRKQLPLAVDFDSPLFGIKEFRIVSGNTPSGTFQLVEHEAPARSTLQQQLQQQQNSNNLDDLSSSITAGADNPQLAQQLAQQATVLIPSQPIMQSSSQQQQSPQYQQQQQYQAAIIASSSGSAALTSLPNSHSKFLIDLEVNQILDRENQSSYQLVVEAIDGGQPPLLGRLMVTVNVQDINDNDPVFTRKSYECHFKEDTSRGTLLLRVQAHDADLEANGQITYLIKRHSSSSQPAGINLNSNSSDNNNNDASATRYSSNNANSNKRQSVVAGGSPIVSTNKPPTQQQRSGGSLQQGGNEIYEQSMDFSNIPINSNNYQQAKPTAGKLQQSNNNYPPQDQPMFEIDPVKGEIYLAHQLDFEIDQMHELLIEARDHGKPSRSGYAMVKVTVIDVNDDPPPTISSRVDNDKKQLYANSPSSEASRSTELLPGRLSNDILDGGQNPFTLINLTNWFSQINSSLLFVIVLVALLSLMFPLCLVKIKSRQLESDYNDTAGLTLTSNNGQTKQSPNHSTSNEHSTASGGGNDSHHRQRRSTGSYAGLNGLDGSGGFGTPNGGKMRYQYTDSSNLYHNPYPLSQSRHTNLHQQPPDSPSNHQMATGGGGGIGTLGSAGTNGGGSGGGTMTLHSHHGLLSSTGGHHHHNHHHSHHQHQAQHPLNHHSLEHHHHHQFSGVGGHHSSSLTYAHHHSRAALLQQAHHHQSSHHLSSVHHGLNNNNNNNNTSNMNSNNNNNKGGTMNSVGTHHSAHPSASPLPATPNTTHSSGLPPNLHDATTAHHHVGHTNQQQHHHHPLLPPLIPSSGQQPQLPPTPCHATAGIFSNWPQTPGSTLGCCVAPTAGPAIGGSSGNVGPLHGISGSTIDCSIAAENPPSAGLAQTTPTALATSSSQQPLDSWFDFGASSSQLASSAQDWCGSYNWDYLSDWVPEYHTIMPLLPDTDT